MHSNAYFHAKDEDASLELTALLSSAVYDKEPRYNLSDIYHGLAQTETATLLVRLYFKLTSNAHL